jgi:hypothetical protein
MQTNTLFSCRPETNGGLTIINSSGRDVLELSDRVVNASEVNLRPVELCWLAWAIENYSTLWNTAAKAGKGQVHPLTILPEQSVA